MAVLSAALAAPCAAFTQGNLRAGTAVSQTIPKGDAVASVAPSSFSATGVTAMGAAVLCAGAVSQRVHPRSTRAQRKVAGICEPITEKFDPLNLGSTDTKMERYTTVEVKHGRIAMIACVGYVIPEVYRFPGCEAYDSGLEALSSLDFLGWLQIFALIGAHEALVKPRDGGIGGFDYGLGIELLEGQSDEEVERKLTVERNNGRLAMVGIMGLMIQDGLFGNPIAALGKDGFWAPKYEWIVKDIPICKTGIC